MFNCTAIDSSLHTTQRPYSKSHWFYFRNTTQINPLFTHPLSPQWRGTAPLSGQQDFPHPSREFSFWNTKLLTFLHCTNALFESSSLDLPLCLTLSSPSPASGHLCCIRHSVRGQWTSRRCADIISSFSEYCAVCGRAVWHSLLKLGVTVWLTLTAELWKGTCTTSTKEAWRAGSDSHVPLYSISSYRDVTDKSIVYPSPRDPKTHRSTAPSSI